MNKRRGQVNPYLLSNTLSVKVSCLCRSTLWRCVLFLRERRRLKFRAQATCPGCQSEWAGKQTQSSLLVTMFMILLLDVLHVSAPSAQLLQEWSASNLCPGVTRDKEFVTKLPPLGYFSPHGQIAVFQACISSCFYLAKNSLIVLKHIADVVLTRETGV